MARSFILHTPQAMLWANKSALPDFQSPNRGGGSLAPDMLASLYASHPLGFVCTSSLRIKRVRSIIGFNVCAQHLWLAQLT